MPDGNRQWVFDELSPTLIDRLNIELSPDAYTAAPALGIAATAAYAPDQTANWPSRLPYSLQPDRPGQTTTTTQIMVPTQVLPLAIAKVSDLLESQLVSRVEQVTTTGTIPEPTTTIESFLKFEPGKKIPYKDKF